MMKASEFYLFNSVVFLGVSGIFLKHSGLDFESGIFLLMAVIALALRFKCLRDERED
jgi:hypothetical protein